MDAAGLEGLFRRAGIGISELEEGLERGRKMDGFPAKLLLATDGLVSTDVAARAAAVDLTEKGGAEGCLYSLECLEEVFSEICEVRRV